MKNHIKYILGTILTAFLFFTGCQDDDLEVGELTAPTNVQIFETYLDKIDGIEQETTSPGLGSGKVRISATADNATSIHIIVEGQTKLQRSGSVTHIFATLGKKSYTITAIAYGKGGLSTSTSKTIEVESLYEPPADLLQMLYGDGTKVWRINNDVKPHFGLGPPAGSNPFEWYSAEPNDKAGMGMYDDRYIFNQDGTFEHITNGDVFGRQGLINELEAYGGSGGDFLAPADIINYSYSNYVGKWVLTAPNDQETLTLTGNEAGSLGFIGYYVGGKHEYKILSRSENEMILSTVDGNGEFHWGFALIAE